MEEAVSSGILQLLEYRVATGAAIFNSLDRKFRLNSNLVPEAQVHLSYPGIDTADAKHAGWVGLAVKGSPETRLGRGQRGLGANLTLGT